MANSLCRGQEKRTMRETEVQIGNSGLIREFPIDVSRYHVLEAIPVFGTDQGIRNKSKVAFKC